MAGYKPFKVNVLSVLDKADFEDEKSRDAARKFVSDKDFKRLFGQRMVDEIVERTKRGKDMHNKSLGHYSKSYKESLIFQIYDKKDPVDLTLTGEMLESISAEDSRYTIIIDVDADNRDKAEGHITGKLGRARARPREFLGLPEGLVVDLFKESMKRFREGSILEILV